MGDSSNDINNLTHKGKVLSHNNANDSDLDDNEDDYQVDIAHEFLNQPQDRALSKKEILSQLIEKSKKERNDKKKQRLENKQLVEALDSAFPQINMLLKKRKREFVHSNDNYDKYLNAYQYAPRTNPTDRIKTEEEIERERLKKLDKLSKQRDVEIEDEESQKEEIDTEEAKAKPLTKKERISMLVEQRLKKAELLKLKDKEKEKKKEVKKSKKISEEDKMEDIEDIEEQYLGEDGEEGEEEDDENEQQEDNEDEGEEEEDEGEEEENEGEEEEDDE